MKKKSLIVFTTNTKTPFGGINPNIYIKKYRYLKAISFSLDEYIRYRLDMVKQINIDSNLRDKLSKVVINDDVEAG